MNETVPPVPDRIRCFTSDIDGTLIGKPDALLAFKQTWESLDQESRPYLIYSSGRLLSDLLALIERTDLPEPDYCICGVGTTIYDFSKQEAIKAFSEIMEDQWDRTRVVEIVAAAMPVARQQPKRYQNAYKSSWYAEEATPESITRLEEALQDAGILANVVYSSGRDLDVLPKAANKSNALGWLLHEIGVDTSETLVAGDTGNDAAMFMKEGIHGIVVGNAQPELLETVVGRSVYRAEGSCADGVLEGLQHFGVIEEVVRPSGAAAESAHSAEFQHLLEEASSAARTGETGAFLEEAFSRAVRGIGKNITDQGFSACSLSDNHTSGTDENYRSVWARDGSITTIGTIRLDHPKIRACQRATLETLITHISPVGQVPANVSIDTGEPDYSGVGGICSIDSGLWVIIAAYEYVRATQDFDFLREHYETLQKAMDWLGAQDANTDGLLEIPEAGDWTDLFGRSYNVLYDEVLWFRANIAFGRLLEYLGRTKQASQYLLWAVSIKRAILRTFWPSLSKSTELAYSFAESQATLGDTRYLLAQVTPFSHDWRCDIFGNVLAFLYNILDHDRALDAFRFMWGSGVSDPFPVVNLYPVVQAGDPGWKSYYTVNLLNLPHHYHNGGIWPFVGGMWVRFINRLGLRDLAIDQLVKLAEINKRGIQGDWEFTEWAHGQTGKPMGKVLQAWSCSEFIAACQDLGISCEITDEMITG